ncbi:M20 family metallopeptidase [Candidatus Woesebacteria bacterium]|nr:M20 family metallopeptidase [Candidatus Woesebacteria bacterium]
MNTSSIAQEIALQLIAIDTSKQNGIHSAMNWIETWCKAQGLLIKRIPHTKAILIETHPEAQKHVNFVTHIDVVPADGWNEAFTPLVKNNCLIGRGAVDDKGPLAICLEVLVKAQQHSHINVSCLIVTDEETQNTEIQEITKANTFHPDLCIVVDGGTHKVFDIGQKGIIRFDVSIQTPGGHSAFEEVEKSASIQLLQFISDLEKLAITFPHHVAFSKTFINVSKISAATVPYGLPTLAIAHIELQFAPPQTSEEWRNQINQLLGKFNEYELNIHWISEPHMLENQKFLNLLHSLPNVRCVTTGGNNLAKDLCLAGVPAVSHCPVSEYIAHCKEEKINLIDFKKGVHSYLKIIELFCENYDDLTKK